MQPVTSSHVSAVRFLFFLNLWARKTFFLFSPRWLWAAAAQKTQSGWGRVFHTSLTTPIQGCITWCHFFILYGWKCIHFGVCVCVCGKGWGINGKWEGLVSQLSRRPRGRCPPWRQLVFPVAPVRACHSCGRGLVAAANHTTSSTWRLPTLEPPSQRDETRSVSSAGQ